MRRSRAGRRPHPRCPAGREGRHTAAGGHHPHGARRRGGRCGGRGLGTGSTWSPPPLQEPREPAPATPHQLAELARAGVAAARLRPAASSIQKKKKSRTTTSPMPPASTTPARASSASWCGVARSAVPAAPAAAAATTSSRSPFRGHRTVRRGGEHREDRALLRPCDGLLGQPGTAGEGVGQHDPAPGSSAAATASASPRSTWERITPEVAARAEKRPAGERLRDADGRSARVRLGRCRTHREQQVRARVAVRDREDVDLVDHRAMPLQLRDGGACPVLEQGGVERREHTDEPNARRRRPTPAQVPPMRGYSGRP